MPPEESVNRPNPGRQPRPRSRMSTDGVGFGRADYINTPDQQLRPTSRPSAPARPITVVTDDPPPSSEPAPIEVPVPEPTTPQAIEVAVPEPVAPQVTEQAEPTPPQPVVTPAPLQLEPELAMDPIDEDQPEKLDFTPPPKPEKKKRFKKIPIHRPQFKVSKQVIAGLVALVFATSAGSGLALMVSSQDSTADALSKALTNALSVTSVHTTGDGLNADYDYSDQKNPLISGTFTAPITGLPATVNGYASLKNSYVSYKTLPDAVPAASSQQVVGNWVQIRTAGVQPPSVPAPLGRAAEPRFRLFGPILFGNVGEQSRKALVKYMIDHKIYDYTTTKPVSDRIDGQKVTRYDVQLNTSQLKVASQSYAAAIGLSPTDIQDAMAGLDVYRGAAVSLFISAKDDQIVRVTSAKAQQTATTSYSSFNKASVASEPQTKLNWQSFAATYTQLSVQVASKQPGSQLDIIRKNHASAIHDALKTYQLQTGSYPSLTNVNDPAWIATNLPGLDLDSFRDPLSTNSAVLATQKPNTLNYSVVNDSAKPGCDNTAVNPCTHYRLQTLLSTNQPFIVTDP